MFDILVDKLKGGKFLTLETTPSHLPTVDNIISKIEVFEFCKHIDGFTTTDSPLSKLKYNPILAAIKLQQRFKKPVIATMTMRDRNKIALQSDLLGANDFDIRAILALTGDPAKMSDQPNVKGVFEGNSNLLLQIINSFNNGMDYAGKPFSQAPKHITPFAVSNSFSKNFKSLQKRLHEKVKNGAVGIITQPVYDIENAKQLISLFDEAKSDFSDDRADSQLILGIFPIVKLRTAQFLKAHVPGIYVPDYWVDELTVAAKISEEEERKVGLRLSQELYINIRKLHPKIHMMSANNFELANELINGELS